jgi:hypothetical protein
LSSSATRRISAVGLAGAALADLEVREPESDFVVVGGIVFPKDKSCLSFGQESARSEAKST